MSSATQEIQLANPVTAHFPAFIFGNATMCEAVVEEGSAAGQHIVICGAGPSLADHIAAYAPRADQLWGCNSALPWLVAQGHPVTHGFAIDQTPAMVGEWASAPDVEYLVASTIHPHLTRFLLDRQRRLRFFHNYVGIRAPDVECEDGLTRSYEDWLYSGLYPATVRVGSGLNAVTRAVDLARYMGAGKVTVLGADCSLRVSRRLSDDVPRGSPAHLKWLRECTVMHVDGGSALASGATPVTFGGEIDGRYWLTKPDLVISAITLKEQAEQLGGLLELVGDTLPNALKGKSEEFMRRLPRLTSADGTVIPLA